MTIIPSWFFVSILVQPITSIQSGDSIAALLTDIESGEIMLSKPDMNTPLFYEVGSRFRRLLERSHVRGTSHRMLPKCLGSFADEASFVKYDTRCSLTLTPSEYCCSVYAEQACLDPSQPLRNAATTVRDRISGLDGTANPYLYDKCMLDNCSSACNVSEGNDVHCKQCATVCQRSCLANLSLLCMRRVCGQNLMSFAEGAVSMGRQSSRVDPSHEWTEDLLKAKVGLPSDDIREIEKYDIIRFVLDLLDSSVAVPMCRDAELVSADRSAGVFVQSGRTYSESLLSCTSNILSPNKLAAIVSDPDILRTDEDCSTIARCERDHELIADDRANAQLRLIKAQIASSVVSR